MPKDTYEARDIWLAAYLDAMGVPFIRAVPVDARRCRFLFENPDDLAWTLGLEWRDKTNAQVNGPALAASYRRMIQESYAAHLGDTTYDRNVA